MDLRLMVHTEFGELPAGRSCDVIVMASVECRAFQSESRASRAPIDLCCVLDHSASMGGGKLDLLKDSMKFMIEQLKPTDRLTVVAFDNHVKTVLAPTFMTAEGKKAACKAVMGIRIGRGTNLSGGLFEGLEQFRLRTEALDVSSVLLFTDGEAFTGITTIPGIVEGVESRMRDLGTCSIFTFGFGTSHNAAMLRAISEAGNGMYYFIA
eukprot:RCo024987